MRTFVADATNRYKSIYALNTMVVYFPMLVRQISKGLKAVLLTGSVLNKHLVRMLTTLLCGRTPLSGANRSKT